MVPHRLGVGRGAHLLAQLREHAADPAPGEGRGGVEGGPEILTRQEAADGAARKRAAAELLGEPRAARGADQETAGEGHEIKIQEKGVGCGEWA